MITDQTLHRMADELAGVRGVVGVVLGGSRARGDALPTSDVDLGVYYDGTPDTLELTRLASVWSGRDVTVGEPGSWGPWVDAGGWLEVEGVAVDWILRDIDRVAAQADRASRGEFAFHPQAGHPLGFLDVSYAAELATGVVLADPAGRLTSLRAAVTAYPLALRDAMVGALWEADFLVGAAGKGARREDTSYVSLALARAVLLCAHALHADAGRWVTNEKGLVPASATLDGAPAGFARDAALALGSLGATEESLTAAIGSVQRLVAETRAAVGDR
ncbi:nucleotidyltransferase domain-containing protein [Terracoccus sp. 273MFTsu3.1]|uniref:nucleotidyltransferase domain-containing protein n=1 Tax=Terracoccus sp. 273MFTsu3.1 TaxID=1172188 RepID=UPI00037326C0|nr:nucleotidyltransferase domain-containing protein [Terracoccus sp. 273MFTsu3.1]